ncbi:hypothetical protein DUNSADRAFT_18002 [Dunaliella salina]|uniref:Uncharacterized protein n=1 Tax=Dunaliella salina TaxID=3046 RepID=A0ABQ7G0V4_DUNSA|nr:hypothetical protein DUNSADRAFT_18002 [Dunaliella salina]|eukprot:KAF5828233.1 hypothetical protein DUNSADRAFT_18002 [Dunaliella salina]
MGTTVKDATIKYEPASTPRPALPESEAVLPFQQWWPAYGISQLSGAILLCPIGRQYGLAVPLFIEISAFLLIFGTLKKKFILVQRVFWVFAVYQAFAWLHIAYIGKAPRVHCKFDVIINIVNNVPRMLVCDLEPLPLFTAVFVANIAFSYTFYTTILQLSHVVAMVRSLSVHLLCVLGFLMLRTRIVAQYKEYVRLRTAGSGLGQAATATDAPRRALPPAHSSQEPRLGDAGAEGSSSYQGFQQKQQQQEQQQQSGYERGLGAGLCHAAELAQLKIDAETAGNGMHGAGHGQTPCCGALAELARESRAGSAGGREWAPQDTLRAIAQADQKRMMRPYRSRVQRNRVNVTIHGQVSPDSIPEGALDGLLTELNKVSMKNVVTDVAVRAGCIVLSWSMLRPYHRESEAEEQAILAAVSKQIVTVTKGWADRMGLPLMQEDGTPLVTVQVGKDGSCAVEEAVHEPESDSPVCRHRVLPMECTIALHTPALLMPPPPKNAPIHEVQEAQVILQPAVAAAGATQATSSTASRGACDASCVVFEVSVEAPAHWGPVRGWVCPADSPEEDQEDTVCPADSRPEGKHDKCLCLAKGACGQQQPAAQGAEQCSDSCGDDRRLTDGGNSVRKQRVLRMLAYAHGKFLPLTILQQKRRVGAPGVRLVQARLMLPPSILAAPAGLPLTLQLFQQATLLCSRTTLLLPHTMGIQHDELMMTWMAHVARTHDGDQDGAGAEQASACVGGDAQLLRQQQLQGQHDLREQETQQQPSTAQQPIPADLAAFASDLADWMLFTSTHGVEQKKEVHASRCDQEEDDELLASPIGLSVGSPQAAAQACEEEALCLPAQTSVSLPSTSDTIMNGDTLIVPSLSQPPCPLAAYTQPEEEPPAPPADTPPIRLTTELPTCTQSRLTTEVSTLAQSRLAKQMPMCPPLPKHAQPDGPAPADLPSTLSSSSLATFPTQSTSNASELPTQHEQQHQHQQREPEGRLVLMAQMGADMLQHAVMCGMVSTAETLLHGLLSPPFCLPFTALVAGTAMAPPLPFTVSPLQQQQQQQPQQQKQQCSLRLLKNSCSSKGPVASRSIRTYTPTYPPLICPRLSLAPTALQSGSPDMVAALLEWGHSLGGPAFAWCWGKDAPADLASAAELLGVAADDDVESGGGRAAAGAAEVCKHSKEAAEVAVSVLQQAARGTGGDTGEKLGDDAAGPGLLSSTGQRQHRSAHAPAAREKARLVQLLLEDGVEGPRMMYELMKARGLEGARAEVATITATAMGADSAAVRGAAAAAATWTTPNTTASTADNAWKLGNAAAPPPAAPQDMIGPPANTIDDACRPDATADPATAEHISGPPSNGAASSSSGSSSAGSVSPRHASTELAPLLPTKHGNSIPLGAEGDVRGMLQHSSLQSRGLRSWWEAVQCTVLGFSRAPCSVQWGLAYEREFPPWSATFMRTFLPVHLCLVAAGTFVGAVRSIRRGEVVDGMLVGLVPGPFYVPGLLSLNRPNATRMQQMHPRAMVLERCFTTIMYGILYVRAGAAIVPSPLLRTVVVNGVLWGIEWLLFVSIVRCFLQHMDQLRWQPRLQQLQQQQQAQVTKHVEVGKPLAARLLA